MKKGLSILLIAAALFGFYGSAVNLNDVLACKDYWEKAGEESTANMNKLEDGLNQLKENEQAYLDGKQQVADGEVALAEGEQTLAEGEATLAQGEADYAAAPGQLAAGEKALAKGYDDYSNLKKLIAGLNTVKKHGVSRTKSHDTYWHDGFSHKASNSDIMKIAAGEKAKDSPGLEQARGVITKTVKAKKGTLDAAAGLGGMKGSLADKILGAKSYAQFDRAVTSGIKPLKNAAKKLDALSAKASGAVKANEKEFNNAAMLIGDPQARQAKIGEAQAKKDELEAKLQQLEMGHEAGLVDDETYNTNKAQLEAGITQCEAGIEKLSDTMNLKKEVAAKIGAALEALGGGDGLSMVEKLDADLYNSLKTDLAVLTLNAQAQPLWASDAKYAQTIGQFAQDMTDLADKLKASAKEARSTASTFKDWDNGYDTLQKGKDNQLASVKEGIPYAFGQMLTNPTIKKAIKTYDKGLINELRRFAGTNKYRLTNDDLDEFDKHLVEISTKIIPRAQKVLAKVKRDAVQQLAAGEKQLAEGYKSYAEAPAKLAEGRQQLEEGRQALEEGRQTLADGKAQLAQYEDGEQQVRDGLATLTETEADLELESILDRLNGDNDFDNGDEHLDLDEGLAAVDVGRGYQAEDGVLITKEITARAVGTGALLGAGVLAVLAAILSFLKKNKGAGVAAILAAAAGAFGAAYGTNAGTYFSDIAGSTAGSAAWVAAGILGAVALVHAIVHFTAKNA